MACDTQKSGLTNDFLKSTRDFTAILWLITPVFGRPPSAFSVGNRGDKLIEKRWLGWVGLG